jgi:hypothetical protein
VELEVRVLVEGGYSGVADAHGSVSFLVVSMTS